MSTRTCLCGVGWQDDALWNAWAHASMIVVRPTTAWSMFVLAGGSFFLYIGQHFCWFGEIAAMGRFQAPHVIVDGRDLAGNSRWNLLARTGPAWSF